MEEGSPAEANDWTKNWRNYINQPISDNLGAILDKLMCSDRKQRYQSAADVLRDLAPHYPSPLAKTTLQPIGAAAAAENRSPLQQTKQLPTSPEPSGWRNIKLYGGVCLGLITASLAILLATRPSTTLSRNVSQDLGEGASNAVAYLEREKAIADYDRAIVLDPSSYYQFYERGILHQELNHKAKAKADFEMTIQLAKKAGKEKDYADAAVRLQQLH